MAKKTVVEKVTDAVTHAATDAAHAVSDAAHAVSDAAHKVSDAAKTVRKSLTGSTAKNTGDDEVGTRGRRNEVLGEVVSNKMQKTISVRVNHMFKHPKYGKYMKASSVFKAHDEKGEAKIGDTVRIHETRPLSRTKRWALSAIVEQAKR